MLRLFIISYFPHIFWITSVSKDAEGDTFCVFFTLLVISQGDSDSKPFCFIRKRRLTQHYKLKNFYHEVQRSGLFFTGNGDISRRDFFGKIHTKTQRKKRTQRGIKGFLSVILSWRYWDPLAYNNPFFLSFFPSLWSWYLCVFVWKSS